MLENAYTWVFGGLGIVAIAALIALAIFGGPFAKVIADVAGAILTPIAGVVGQGASMLVKAEADGGIDMLATGQRILFVATCCTVAWFGAEHYMMKWVHGHYWLAQKHYAIVQPHAVAARGHR